MTASTPWWYSGDGASDGPADDRARDGREGTGRPRFDIPGMGIPGLDIAGLASGAQQLVDLARQAILAPHAGHADPREHPECMVCRTMTAFGEARMTTGRTAPAPVIEWIALEPPRR